MTGEAYRITFIFPDRTERQIEVGPDQFILVEALRAGLDLPYMCLQGWCITCAGSSPNKGCWDQNESRRYYEEDREEGFILLCTAKPCSDLRVLTHQQAAMRDHRLKNGLPTPLS